MPASLIKVGAGTLSLNFTANHYTGGTYVEAGTLNIGASGAVLPPAATSPSFRARPCRSALRSAITRQPRSARSPSTAARFGFSAGSPAYYTNRLTINSPAGTVDFTGSTGALDLSGPAPT